MKREQAGGRLHGSFRGQTCRRQASLLPGFHWPRGSSFHILTIKFDWLLSPPGALLLEKAQDAQFPSLIPLGCSDSGVQKTNPGFIQSHICICQQTKLVERKSPGQDLLPGAPYKTQDERLLIGQLETRVSESSPAAKWAPTAPPQPPPPPHPPGTSFPRGECRRPLHVPFGVRFEVLPQLQTVPEALGLKIPTPSGSQTSGTFHYLLPRFPRVT